MTVSSCVTVSATQPSLGFSYSSRLPPSLFFSFFFFFFAYSVSFTFTRPGDDPLSSRSLDIPQSVNRKVWLVRFDDPTITPQK